jgi:hypothetical protein
VRKLIVFALFAAAVGGLVAFLRRGRADEGQWVEPLPDTGSSAPPTPRAEASTLIAPMPPMAAQESNSPVDASSAESAEAETETVDAEASTPDS